MKETIDYKRHNEEVREVWDAFYKRKPYRVPIVFNFNPRFYLLTSWLNVEGYTFEQYIKDPDIMLEVQLKTRKWIRLNVPQDMEMGYPEDNWGGVYVDLQNFYEAGWLGNNVVFPEGDVPYAAPLPRGKIEELMESGIPDPLNDNWMGKGMEIFFYLKNKVKETEFEGIPVGESVYPPGAGTDGPFTVAAALLGATELCIALYEDPDFVHRLMNFITEATIVRIKAVWDLMNWEYPVQSWGFADDSIELLSTKQYMEFVLPYHKRLISTFSKGGPNAIHLCGKVQRHLKIIKEELNVDTFDLGFPTDLGLARRELGPDVLLRGNLHPELLRRGTITEIEKETKRICQSGVMEGGRWIFCEGNNVAPETPLQNFWAMYNAGRKYGVYNNRD
ncbi:hypothetical protein H5T87_11495 [bacterium]|nr:hypothetical protein [bacterium]